MKKIVEGAFSDNTRYRITPIRQPKCPGTVSISMIHYKGSIRFYVAGLLEQDDLKLFIQELQNFVEDE